MRTKTVRVLLVEDDDGDALLVEALLEEASAPFVLARAHTLAEAESLLSDSECVLLDLGLPDSQGLDGLHRLLAKPNAPAILVLTGHDDEREGISAVAAGAEDFLIKGKVDGELLLRGVRYAVERRRADNAQFQLREAKLLAAERSRLERGLLPPPLLQNSDVNLEVRYQPGGQRMLLGGDFYDAVGLPDGTVHAIIGDVCGHGPDEAALGVCLRIAWRALILAGEPAEKVLRTLDQVLVAERHGEGIFTTACMITVAPDRRSARYFLAGHPEPLMMVGREIVDLPPSKIGVPLGVLPDYAWTGVDVPLPSGWSLACYTDGLIEGRVPDDVDRLGVERLCEILARHLRDGPDWMDSVIAEVTELNGGALDDDVALLLLKDGK
ncbi:PP2C family protein-serine/threonine phosphatase [Lentzea flaviverrucosa]|uniref:Serine phosphatase RsbU, regulator of sigma subunit n=1 Tax=Lentzea flaviverrucosa TaxID=200379 RepID=A0A1H9KF17_9PSEU|nr:SpoIIE family protein phosphatase [Lentzea flaviverrucosa]RDI17854.1 serine phosphatase RsbU (regulator of sigma subunit) [Lentzea flaviverrucosa]SEQ97744.1 Serine phosphatase RsbU, regulator of sigma subunit [Lentzea flaviverrucosa]